MSIVNSIFVPTYSRGTKKMSVKVFLMLFLVSFLLSVFFSFLINNFITKIPSAGGDVGVGFFVTLLLVVLMVPLIEESCFRLWLKRGKNNFAFGVLSACFLLLSCVFCSSAPWGILVLMLLASVVLFLAVLASRLKPRFFLKHYTAFYYISIVSFGLVHLGNYSASHLVSPFVFPLLAVPYIIAGLIFGYTRVTYGFRYGLLLHAMLNLCLLLLV